MYRKSALHLLKYTANLHCICLSTLQNKSTLKQMQYRFALNYETLGRFPYGHSEYFPYLSLQRYELNILFPKRNVSISGLYKKKKTLICTNIFNLKK